MDSLIPGQRTVLALRDALTAAGFTLHAYQPQPVLGTVHDRTAGLHTLPNGDYLASLAVDGQACGVRYRQVKENLVPGYWDVFDIPRNGDPERLADRVLKALGRVSRNIVSVQVAEVNTCAGYGHEITLAVTLRVPQTAVHPPVPAGKRLHLASHPLGEEGRTYVYQDGRYIGLLNHETRQRRVYGADGTPEGFEQYLHLHRHAVNPDDRETLKAAARTVLDTLSPAPAPLRGRGAGQVRA